MIYKLKMWISAEVIDPFFSLYSYVYKNFVLALTLSFCLIVVVCTLNPSIVFIPKQEGFIIYEPEFHIKHGRMTTLIIKKGNKKFFINCAYFRNENGSFCKLYKPRKILKVEGGFFPNSSLFFKNKYIVVTRIRFEDEKGSLINFSTSEEKIVSWWNWVMFPTLLIRYLILIWLVVVVSILLLKAFKYQNKS
ncbi:hypothetical protein Q5X60_12960 [Acinetobacter baumannii]|nr:hypothetical protein [Acinetobacter baumannii]